MPVKLESEIADHMQCVRQESGLVPHKESCMGPDYCAASSPAAEMESEAMNMEALYCSLMHTE
jgi:coenzyme F420-reducing hydrogenase gamma subunit